MFKFHEKTCRRIYLAGFIVLCLVPTMAVLGWIIAWHLPSHVQQQAEQLSRELGLEVSVTALQHLRPGVMVFENFELTDPETRHVVLRCGKLEARRTYRKNFQGNLQPVLKLFPSRVAIDASELPGLWQVVHRVLTGRTNETAIELRPTQIDLQWEDKTFVLKNASAHIEAFADWRQATLQFHLEGAEANKPIQITTVRNKQIQPSSIGFEINTYGTEVPCSLFALAFGSFKTLGPFALFRGHLHAYKQPAGWEGQINGQFSRLELDRLVTQHFPHTLQGFAELTLQEVQFRHGRIEHAAGNLTANGGTVSHSLLTALADRLKLVLTVPLNHSKGTRSYDRLAFAFRMTSDGLQLYGQCSGLPEGTVLSDRSGALLITPDTKPQPVAALLLALAPEKTVQVPATRQINWLAGRLPLPTTQTEELRALADRRSEQTPHPSASSTPR